jgi:hypothetical protein
MSISKREEDLMMEEIFKEKELLIKNINPNNEVFKLLRRVEMSLDWALHVEDFSEKTRLMEECLLLIQQSTKSE